LTLDLDKELETAIWTAAALYGERYPPYKLLPVAYHQKNHAQIIVDDVAKTLSVFLADPAPFEDKDAEAKYEIWHEAVHCLFPVNRMDTLWFEEGVALRFARTHTPISPKQLANNRREMALPWKEVYKAFNVLNPSDDQIRAIRELAPNRLLDDVKPEMVRKVCKVRFKVYEALFQRLPVNTR
jgi:hypothetical protein